MERRLFLLRGEARREGVDANELLRAVALGAETAFVLRNADWDYTRALARFFKEGFEKHGGEILAESSYHTGDTEYSAHIAKIRAMNPPPDVVYAAVNPGDDATFVRQAREAGVTLPIIDADGSVALSGAP